VAIEAARIMQEHGITDFRDAKAKAMASTKGAYDAKMKALSAERKTAATAAEKKIKAAKPA
jgi:hypothetical protein